MIRSGNCRLHPPCGGLNTKSACCPARNAKLAPFVSNQKAVVSLAILCLIDFGSYLLCRASAI